MIIIDNGCNGLVQGCHGELLVRPIIKPDDCIASDDHKEVDVNSAASYDKEV